MSITTRLKAPTSQDAQAHRHELSQWGGIAGLAGVAMLVGAAVVVASLALPDASDVETLTDFADIKSGRIAEHFLYLGALMLFALHILVLHRLLRTFHPAASLFGAAMAEMGLVIMAASSLLHVSTAPLADLYSDPDTPRGDLAAIEYAWHGAQSVFDTMLTTGVFLVPIGIVLLGIAMSRTEAFGSRMSLVAIALGVLGTIGAVVAILDPGSAFSAASVLTIAVFHVVSGWRTLSLRSTATIDLTAAEPTPLN